MFNTSRPTSKASRFAKHRHPEGLNFPLRMQCLLQIRTSRGPSLVLPSLSLHRRLNPHGMLKKTGNMYTASYTDALHPSYRQWSPRHCWQRVGLFSFGSGFVPQLFTLRVKGDTLIIRRRWAIVNRLAQISCPPEEFVQALHVRVFMNIFGYGMLIFFSAPWEKPHAASYTPEVLFDNIWPGSYYLESSTQKYRRKYLRHLWLTGYLDTTTGLRARFDFHA